MLMCPPSPTDYSDYGPGQEVRRWGGGVVSNPSPKICKTETTREGYLHSKEISKMYFCAWKLLRENRNIWNMGMKAQSTNMSVLPYQNHPSAPTPTPSIRTKLWGGNWKMWKLKKIILMKEIKVKNVALANEFRDHYSQIWLRPERCP